MKLALFTDGQKSIAGKTEFESSSFDSSLIFQDPDLFATRFLFQMKSRFGINDFSKVTDLIFAIPGVIDFKSNTIIKSDRLNDLSRIKIYDGFSFNLALSSVFKKEQIHILTDVVASALGVSVRIRRPRLPSLILTLEDEVGVTLIDRGNRVILTTWEKDLVPSLDKSVSEALGRNSIYSLLLAKKVDINKEYTTSLIHAINYLCKKFEKDRDGINHDFFPWEKDKSLDKRHLNSVFILGEKTQYVDEGLLKDNLTSLKVTMVAKSKNLVLNGCFAYLA